MRNILRVLAFLGVGLLMIARAYAAEAAPAAGKPKAVAVKSAKKAAPKTALTADAKKPLAEKPLRKARKIVEGQVVQISKRSISVEFESTGSVSNEMLLPLGSQVTVEGAAKLSDLKQGDRVKVGIEQTFQDVPGSDPVLVKTEALAIVLVLKPAEAKAAGAKAVQ